MPKPSVETPRSEIELLLFCARTQMDAANADRIRALLQNEINWPYLIQLAEPHGVLPLLYWNLNNVCPKAMPGATLVQLHEEFQDNTWYNLFLTRELLKLLQLLESNGIPAIPYKGPILADSVYGNLALRQFSDLDIFIRKQDVLKAKNLLIAQGYQPKEQLTDAQETARLQSDWEYQLVLFNEDLTVELHWRISADYFLPMDSEQVWQNVRPVSLAGTTILTLSPENLLLILCTHGSKHLWKRLKMVCDVAELIRLQQELDWEQVMAQSKRLDVTRMLFLGLVLARDLLKAPLPEVVQQEIQTNSAVKSLAARLAERLFTEVCQTDDPTMISDLPFHVSMRGDLGARFRYLLHVVNRLTRPNEADQALMHLPPFLSFTYYLVRPIRLVSEYGLSPLKRS